MQYTLGQAAKALSHVTHAYGSTDVRAAINSAVQALAGMAGWERLRRVVRILSAHPAFALPQGCAGLVRACVAGRPVTIRGQDFEFLHSGPGHLSRPPAGFSPVAPGNILDRGVHPIPFVPKAPFRLYAESSVEDEPDLSAKGIADDGRCIRRDSVRVVKTGSEPILTDVAFTDLTGLVLPDDLRAYVELCCEDADGVRYPVSRLNPEVKAPEFHRYEVQGTVPRQGVEILAEVRLDPLPLVDDDDIVPFDTLDPIGWMMQADWMVRSGEVDAAQKLHALAAGWLKTRETTADMVQSSLVVNSIFDNSLGEVSMEAVNI